MIILSAILVILLFSFGHVFFKLIHVNMSFWALFYKAWRIRVRHWFQTLIIIIIPLIVPIITLIQSPPPDRIPENITLNQEPIIYNKSYREYFENFAVDNLVIAYCPKNPITRNLMKDVEKKLMKGRKGSIFSFETDADIEKWFMNSTDQGSMRTRYGVVFEMGKSDSNIPRDFKYTIRTVKSSSLPATNILFPIFQLPGPNEAGSAYTLQGFLGLKITIDDALFTLLNITKTNWTLQEFPYPAYKTNDERLAVIAQYLSVIVAALFLYGFNAITSLAANDKSSGIAERMKMFGMNDFMLLLSYVIHGLLPAAISCLFFVILMKIPEGAGPVFAESNFFIVWIVLLMFCVHSICYFLAVSSLFNNSNIAIAVSSILFFIPYAALTRNQDLSSFPIVGQTLTSLLPILYLFWAFQNIFGFENVGQGSLFTNIIKVPTTGYCDLPLIELLVLSAVGCVLFSLVYCYIINIKPGPYGYAKPWHFIFPKQIFACFKITPLSKLKNERELDVSTKGLYEKVPDNVEVGLNIVNLHKRFGNVIPIKDLSLHIYVGQITALLGHNGAGKTTTLSIISGMFSPTSGSIFYRGYDIFSNLKAFRYELGLCPQEDMLISDISAWEHLLFFGMLKGIPLKEIIANAQSALKEVGLFERKDVIVSQLSGGMKRKLCLALALVGSPKVIVLDEPTSGLDPESRREIWNILLALRENRIMIITTHFMEEADVLGDQIAIMDHGEIKCYGSPMFLKKHYGAGYQITVCSSKMSVFDAIIDFVMSHIPTAVVLNKTEESIVFNISSSNACSFPALFKSLEMKEDFQISRIGISCTSMEDVFLKVGEEAESSVPDSNTNGRTFENSVHISSLTGTSAFSSFMQRFSALFVKNIVYVRGKWMSFLLTVILLPVAVSYWTIEGTTSVITSDANTPPLDFDLKIYGPTEVLVAGNRIPQIRSAFIDLIKNRGSYDVQVPKEQNIIEGLLTSAKEDELNFRQSMIVAGDFSDSIPNVLFSSIAIHAPVIAVNLLYNSLLKAHPIGKNFHISTTYHPYSFSSEFCAQGFSVDALAVVFSWVVLVFCLGGVVGQCFIKTPHSERTTISKHLQLMTGLSPLTYWLSFFLWDLITYCFCITLVLIVLVSFDTTGILSPNNGAGVVFLIMFLFGFSGIWMAYCFSYMFKTVSNAFNLFNTGIVFFVMATLILFNIIAVDSSYSFIIYILRLIPFCPFISAIQQFTTIAVLKVKCSFCPNSYLLNECKDGEILKHSYFDSDFNKELYFLGLDWIIYLVIIMLIEYDFFSKILGVLNSSYIGTVEKSDLVTVESDVAKEKDRVDAVLHSSNNEGATTVIVDSLAKKYTPTFTAVHDVTFAAKEGECFGLLGVNGAGKSTTFNILTGRQLATQGNVIIKGYNLKDHKLKCLSYMGYCPQSSALADSLTGRQMLTLFANLRLTHRSEIRTLVNKWISLLGLEEYCDRPCGTYSGGNKRKLSTALAFISNPEIILLDEPTSGVDPVTRRKLWIVLKECQSKKQTVIISSHSMDECEAVCDRLTIMAQGYMQCIGNVQHLKSLYGQGFVILIKLKNHSDDEVINVKEHVLREFGPEASLKDEHMVMLHYHLNDPTYKLSALFAGMEKIKEKFEIIDDYTISDSSLEHVFLSFAKKSSES